MAKNNSRVLIPKFLDVQEARILNNLVYSNVGCFLFMTLPEEKLLMPKPTIDGGANYVYNILNLYKMYNDYGHFFFWFFLQESQLPDEHMLEEVDLEKEKIISLRNEQTRAKNHYVFVTRIARHVLTHGIFQQPTALTPYYDPKIQEMENIFSTHLSGKKWPENDSDWRTINQWLWKEADFVYDWIKRWATIWGYCKEEKENLQRRFYYGRWDYANNKDNCELVEEAVIPWECNGSTIFLYEENNKLTSFARAFPFQRIYDAKNYLAAASSGCVRSQYEEGSLFWRSDNPDVNLKFLFKNINFNGIENVRKQMYHPKRLTNVCPDAFKLYLEGLVGKIVTLPVINVRPQKSSRFRR